MQHSSKSESEDILVYVEEFKLQVPFRTKSDAAMASFALKYRNQIAATILSDLLCIFKGANFRMEDVSFSRLEDIEVHIGDFRRTVQEQRSRTSNVYNSGIPGLILGLVTESLSSDREPFDHRACRKLYPVPGEPSNRCANLKALRRMSLVHRSWTYHSQRVLRRCISVSETASLRSLLSSPSIGPWVQELFVSSPEIQECKTAIDMKEVGQLLTLVLTMCPNIRHLFLSLPFYLRSSDFAIFGSVIREIASLRSLQSLWLYNVDCSKRKRIGSPLLDLFRTLTELKRLRCLHLYHWDTLTDEKERNITKAVNMPTTLKQLFPGPELTSMTIRVQGFRRSMEVVSWLLRPCGAYRLRSLNLLVSSNPESTFPIDDALLHALPYIRRLRLYPYAIQKFWFFPYATILSHCAELRELSIFISRESDVYAPGVPPYPPLEALTDFNIHYIQQSLLTEVEDRLLCDMVSSMPNLRKVGITVYPKTQDSTPDVPSKMFRTVCADRGIEFSMQLAFRPYFF